MIRIRMSYRQFPAPASTSWLQPRSSGRTSASSDWAASFPEAKGPGIVPVFGPIDRMVRP